MKASKLASLLLIAMLIGGCGLMDRRSGGDEPAEPELAGDQKEITGMLLVLDPDKCPVSNGCGPRFSLLGRDLTSQVALEGEVDPAHNHRILTVVGTPRYLPSELAENPGYSRVSAIVDVDRYRTRSDLPYYPALVDKTTEITLAQFGCDLLWDKSYSWTIEAEQPLIKVRMTDTQAASPRPWVELTFDGNSGNLVTSRMQPEDVNPCG